MAVSVPNAQVNMSQNLAQTSALNASAGKPTTISNAAITNPIMKRIVKKANL